MNEVKDCNPSSIGYSNMKNEQDIAFSQFSVSNEVDNVHEDD